MIGVALVGLVALGVLGMRVLVPPQTAIELLIGEVIILAAMSVGVLWWLRAMARTTLHKQSAAWVLMIGVSKVAGATIGVALDQPPEVVHAFDVVTLMFAGGVATFMVRRALWPSLAFGVAAVVGVAVWPDRAFLMHDLALAGLSIAVVGYVAWRPVRNPRASGRGGRG